MRFWNHLHQVHSVHFQQEICTQEIGNIHFVARHNGHLSEKGKQMLSSTLINRLRDIKFSVHDAFLESPSSGTLKITFIRYTQNNLHQVHSK
jgi:hypothetical protein